MPVVQIELQFDDKGAVTGARKISAVANAADDAQKAVASIGTASMQAAKSVSNAGDSGAKAANKISDAMKDAVKTVLALVGAYKALDTAIGFAQRGVKQNSEWEQSKIGIASVLASVREIRDEQGNLVTGAAAYQQALGMAEEAMNRIKIMGLETTATSQDLVAGFQQLIGPAAAAGLTMKQTLDFTMSMVQSLGAIGIPFNQLSAEARSLLDGTIVPTQDRLATTLGITGDMVRNWKAQGVLAQMLLEKMSAFAAAGDDVAKTWNGVTSNLQDAIDTISMGTSKGLYDNLKTALMEVQDLLVTTKGEAAGISPDFAHIAATLTQIQTGVGEGILGTVRSLSEGVKELNASLGDRGVSNALQDVSTTIKTATAALLGFVVARKSATAVTDWGKYKESILDVARATATKAQADLTSAQSALTEAKAEQQRWVAQSKTREVQAYAAQSTANLNRLRQEQVAIDQAVTVAERQLAAAMQSSVTATRNVVQMQQNGVSAAQAFGSRVKSAFSGLLGFFGGPWGLAITGATAALGYLYSKQDDAARAAELHAKAEKNYQEAVKGATDETGNLTKKLTDLQRQRLEMANQQFGDEFRLKIRELGSEIETLMNMQGKAAANYRTALIGTEWAVPTSYTSTLESMFEMLKRGEMTVDDFQGNLASLRQSAVDAGYGNSEFVKTLDSLNQQGGVVDLLREIAEKMGLIRSASAGAAAGVRESASEMSAAAKAFNLFYTALEKARRGTKDGDSKKSPDELIIERGRSSISGTSADKAADTANKRSDAAAYLKRLREQLKETNDEAKKSVISNEIKLISTGMAQIGTSEGAANKVGNAAEKWKQFRLEIAALNGEGAKSAVTLEKQNKEIEDAGKAAGKSASEISQMKADYAAAFQGNTLKEFNKHVVELEGNTAALRDLKIEEEVRKWTTELSSAGVAGADLEGKITRLKDALAKQAEVKDAQTSLSFIKEYSQLSGDFSQNQKYLLEMLEAEEKIYRDKLPTSLQPYIDKWQELKKLQEARDPLSGSIRGLRSYSNEAMNLAKGIEGAWTSGFTAMEDALVKFTMTGKLSFQDMANSIISDLMRIAIRSSITGPLASGLGSLLNFGGGSSALPVIGGPSGGGVVPAYIHHSGGMVDGSGPTRTVSAYDYLHAPRFHSGGGFFKRDEYPAILQYGERVLNRQETAAYNAREWAGRDVMGRSGAAAQATPQVFVSIQNNTGAEVSQETRTDNMGRKNIRVIIGDAAASQMVTAGSSLDKATRARFGIQPQVTRR